MLYRKLAKDRRVLYCSSAFAYRASCSSPDLLKMDIEGAEYVVIRDMVATKLLLRLLCIEFEEVHAPMDSEASTRIKQHIEVLEQAGMRCIAVDGSDASVIRAY